MFKFKTILNSFKYVIWYTPYLIAVFYIYGQIFIFRKLKIIRYQFHIQNTCLWVAYFYCSWDRINGIFNEGIEIKRKLLSIFTTFKCRIIFDLFFDKEIKISFTPLSISTANILVLSIQIKENMLMNVLFALSHFSTNIP